MSDTCHMERIALDINWQSGTLNVQLETGIALCVLFCDTGYIWTSGSRR